ncbi:MAG: hypothetical protein ACP5NW_05975 [Candidatus Woesearchaeota archaeon]
MKRILVLMLILTLLVTACSTYTPQAQDTTQTGTTDEGVQIEYDNTLNGLFSDRITQYTVAYTLNVSELITDIIYVFDLPKYVTLTSVGGGEVRIIFDGTNMVSCTSGVGSIGPWQCFKVSVAHTYATTIDNEITKGTAKMGVIGNCTVVGESGTKYEIVSSDNVKSQACYTSEGILLEMSIPELDYHIVATRIIKDYDSTLFVAPAEPQDI